MSSASLRSIIPSAADRYRLQAAECTQSSSTGLNGDGNVARPQDTGRRPQQRKAGGDSSGAPPPRRSSPAEALPAPPGDGRSSSTLVMIVSMSSGESVRGSITSTSIRPCRDAAAARDLRTAPARGHHGQVRPARLTSASPMGTSHSPSGTSALVLKSIRFSRYSTGLSSRMADFRRPFASTGWRA